MLAMGARTVAASPAAADAVAEFASAVVVAIAAPCDDADRTGTICPSHRTGLIYLVCSS